MRLKDTEPARRALRAQNSRQLGRNRAGGAREAASPHRLGPATGAAKHVLVFLIVISICRSIAYADEPSSTDSILRAISVKDYRRVIAFSPAVTEIIYRLGAEDRLAGVASFSDYPPQAKEKPAVGGILNIDSEKIISLSPDLIISPPGAIANEKLPAFGADLAYVPDKTLAEVADSFAAIGRLLGKAGEGKALAEGLRKAVERAGKRNEGRPKVRTLIVIGYEPLWVAGGYGAVEELLEAAGGENVAGDVKKDFYAINFEKVLGSKPAIIVDLTLDAPDTNERRDSVKAFWKRFGSIPAAANGRVEFIDSDLLTIPGPRLAEGLAALERALWGEQAGKAGNSESR